MYDLTLMQKLIGYKANNFYYKYNDYDFFVGQRDFLLYGDREFNFLFGGIRKERLKEIEKEKKIRRHNACEHRVVKNKFFKNYWFLKKMLDNLVIK